MTERTETLYQLIDRCRIEARNRDDAVDLIYNEVTAGMRMNEAMRELVTAGIKAQLDDFDDMDRERAQEP